MRHTKLISHTLRIIIQSLTIFYLWFYSFFYISVLLTLLYRRGCVDVDKEDKKKVATKMYESILHKKKTKKATGDFSLFKRNGRINSKNKKKTMKKKLKNIWNDKRLWLLRLKKTFTHMYHYTMQETMNVIIAIIITIYKKRPCIWLRTRNKKLVWDVEKRISTKRNAIFIRFCFFFYWNIEKNWNWTKHIHAQR